MQFRKATTSRLHTMVYIYIYIYTYITYLHIWCLNMVPCKIAYTHIFLPVSGCPVAVRRVHACLPDSDVCFVLFARRSDKSTKDAWHLWAGPVTSLL